MNLVEFNTFLKNNHSGFKKPKCDYYFLKKITLTNIAGNYNMPVTPRLTSIEYKTFLKLVDKWIK